MYFKALIVLHLQHPLKRRGKAVVTDLLVAKLPALLTSVHCSSSLCSLTRHLFPTTWHNDLPERSYISSSY